MKVRQGLQRKRPAWGIPRGMGGFTVTELLIAMVVVAILVGVSLPLFATAMQSYRLDGAARKVAGDLRYTQSLAVAQGGLYRFHSGDDGGAGQPGRYRIERSTDGGGTWTGITQWYLLSSEFVGTSIPSIKDSAATPATVYEVRFNSRGACVNCSTLPPPIVVTVSSTSGTRAVQVRSAGSVNIQ